MGNEISEVELQKVIDAFAEGAPDDGWNEVVLENVVGKEKFDFTLTTQIPGGEDTEWRVVGETPNRVLEWNFS
jgi:hypothetical protein